MQSSLIRYSINIHTRAPSWTPIPNDPQDEQRVAAYFFLPSSTSGAAIVRLMAGSNQVFYRQPERSSYIPPSSSPHIWIFLGTIGGAQPIQPNNNGLPIFSSIILIKNKK